MLTKGLIHVYTGGGKGKTTCSLGLAMRASGHNLTSYMIQFLKGGDTGELFAVQKYAPYLKIVQFGKDALKEKQMKIFGFGHQDENKLDEDEIYVFPSDNEEKEPSRMALEHAKYIISSGMYDLVILDEINCAMDKKLISVSEVVDILSHKPPHVEVVLTGRGAPKEVIEVADYVTVMERVKHPYDKGIMARKGIEY